MLTNNRLSIYVDPKDTDIIKWCEAQTNLSAAFRDLVRSNTKYTNIMKELQALNQKIDKLQFAPQPQETKPKRSTKPKVDPDILAALDNI